MKPTQLRFRCRYGTSWIGTRRGVLKICLPWWFGRSFDHCGCERLLYRKADRSVSAAVALKLVHINVFGAGRTKNAALAVAT